LIRVLIITIALRQSGRFARGVNTSGMLAGGMIAFIIAGRELKAFWVLLVVFLLTLVATRVGRSRKQQLRVAEPRSGRSASQVAANLGVAALCLALPAFNGFMLLALSALAEAAADTVSSEFGSAFPGRTVLITTWQPVTPGTDGGISFTGTLSGAAAALIVAGASYAFGLIHQIIIQIAASFEGGAHRAVDQHPPRRPAEATTATPGAGINPKAYEAPATINAAAAPERVPVKLMPPSVPGVTGCQVVIKTVRPGKAEPNSLDTVSAAASASAERASSMNPLKAGSARHRAATPRLAATCEAERPERGSATRNCCLRDRPTRVATNVRRKTTRSTQKAFNSRPAMMKAIIPPASIPEVLTPLAKRPIAAKAIVMIRTRIKEGPVPCIHRKSPRSRHAARSAIWSGGRPMTDWLAGWLRASGIWILLG